MTGELILYTTEDGGTQVFLRATGGTVWLTQAQMALLFDTSVSNINKHIKTLIEEGEQSEATIEYFSIVQTEGGRPTARLKAEADFDECNMQTLSEARIVEKHFRETVHNRRHLPRPGKFIQTMEKQDAR